MFNLGALFSQGDGHAAQGGGEVCINDTECPLELTWRFHLHKQQPLLSPIEKASEAARADSTANGWVVGENRTDLADTARAAPGRIIDLLASRSSI